MAVRARQGDRPGLGKLAEDRFGGDHPLARRRLVRDEEVAAGVGHRRGAVDALAPEHPSPGVADAKGIDFRMAAAMSIEHAVDRRVIKPAIRLQVFQRVGDGLQGQIDASEDAAEFAFQQRRQVGRGIPYLCHRLRAAVKETPRAEGDHHRVEGDDAEREQDRDPPRLRGELMGSPSGRLAWCRHRVDLGELPLLSALSDAS